MKVCNRCGGAKDDSDFYTKDRTCKECRKALVRANRRRNIDHYRSYDRKRAALDHRVAARRRYSQSERGKEAARQARRAYEERDPQRRQAHIALGNAVRDGQVWVAPCCMAPACFNTDDLEAHHTHYGDPLVVVWLCRRCHVRVHREHRQMVREGRA